MGALHRLLPAPLFPFSPSPKLTFADREWTRIEVSPLSSLHGAFFPIRPPHADPMLPIPDSSHRFLYCLDIYLVPNKATEAWDVFESDTPNEILPYPLPS